MQPNCVPCTQQHTGLCRSATNNEKNEKPSDQSKENVEVHQLPESDHKIGLMDSQSLNTDHFSTKEK